MNIIILLLYIYDTPPCCQPESNIYRCNSCCCWLVKRKKPKIIIISEERTATFMQYTCVSHNRQTQIVYSSELIPNLLRISAFLCAVCVVHGMELSCLIIWSDVTCFVIYVSISKIYTNKMQKRRHKKRTKKIVFYWITHAKLLIDKHTHTQKKTFTLFLRSRRIFL